MAWYHVGNCSCPIGCCCCGDPKRIDAYLYYDPIKRELFESKWDKSMAKFCKKYRNQFIPEFHRDVYYYIGLIDTIWINGGIR